MGSKLEYDPLPAALRREMQRPTVREVRLYLGGEHDVWDPAEWPLRWDVLRWTAEGKQVVLIAPLATLRQLPWDVSNSLANLLETGNLAKPVDSGGLVLHVIDGQSADPTLPTLIAEVGGEHISRRWAVTRPGSLVLGEDFGRHVPLRGDVEHRTPERVVVLRQESQLAAIPGSPQNAEFLRRQPEGMFQGLEIRDQLNGAISDFGRRFWQQMFGASPRLRQRLGHPQRLHAVLYSDRYLRSPLTMRLLYEVLNHLREQPGGIGPGTAVRIITAQLPSSQHTVPVTIAHDWQNERIRQDAARGLFSGWPIPVNIESRNLHNIRHARELILTLADQSTWVVRLDQGLGFLDPVGHPPPHPFALGGAQQAADVLRQRFAVTRRDPSSALFYVADGHT